MPVPTTYPGVYIEEIPSGVRTITGVSTSVAGFVGAARRGPVGLPRHIFAFSDYERIFGGLDAYSEMAYAVRQFFLNGGQEAWVVRAAGNATAAHATLQNLAAAPVDVLDVTATSAGASGNAIQLFVDWETNFPDSTFNLSLVYPSTDDPQNAVLETFTNLSMNPADARFAVAVINGTSTLVTVAPSPAPPPLTPAQSISGQILTSDIASLIPATGTGSIRVAINNNPPVIVTLLPGTPTTLHQLTDQIQNAVINAGSTTEFHSFTCSASPPGPFSTITATITTVSPNGDVLRILPGPINDLSSALKLGAINGGTEIDSFAAARPAPMPANGTLYGGELTAADIDTAGGQPAGSLTIALNGDTGHAINLDDHHAIADPQAKLSAIAQDIAAKVQAVVPPPRLKAAYAKFTARITRKNSLSLRSGLAGPTSQVAVAAGAPHDVSSQLKLTSPDALIIAGKLTTLSGGTETPPPWTGAVETSAYLGPTGTSNQGIYALDGADFNLLVLAGVTNDAITAAAAAYCQKRRAFYIGDPPQGKSVDDMATYMIGADVPKSEYGALYYPYVRVADPLAGGALRSTPPSGTMAGIYARTDASRGVWKAPAGTDATLVGVNALDVLMNDGQNGSLNQLGLNAIRLFPVYGVIAWGARTFMGADVATSEYKYIPVRRLALYIEESLYRGTKWVVFEPNDEPLWAQIRLNLGAFMQDLFRKGAFQGASPRQAYFVKCDGETTTQNDINLGTVNIVVGFAPLKPAEFVIIQIQQIAGQLAA
jgi:hypothetical protein